jgi:hypothetical protein
MRPKQLKKFDMFLKLSSFLDKNKKVWESVHELQKAIDKFNYNIERLQELKAEIDTDHSIEKDKK